MSFLHKRWFKRAALATLSLAIVVVTFVFLLPSIADYSQVWAAGGIPHAVFPTTFDELVKLTGGEPAEVA